MEPYFLPIFLLIFGLLFTGIGAFLLYRNKQISKYGKSTTAKIINFHMAKEYDSDTKREVTTKIPVIEFTNERGVNEQQLLTSFSTKDKVNDTLSITYLKKDNDYQIIRNDKANAILGPLIFITLGSFPLLIAIFMLLG